MLQRQWVPMLSTKLNLPKDVVMKSSKNVRLASAILLLFHPPHKRKMKTARNLLDEIGQT